MSWPLYGELDYVFGQRMLALRTSIGLTQEGLAAALGITRKTIGRWEAGEMYPKAAHLQALLAFALQQGAFAAGQEEEEIRAFWSAARQKVLLDETWLHELLRKPTPPRQPAPGEQHRAAEQLSASPISTEPRVDWGEALDVHSFYGRTAELALLCQWIGEERCRVVSVLGMGGIGKSALAITVMHQVARHFDVVIWRSLRDSPTCATLVQSCLQILDSQAQPEVRDPLEECLRRLMEQLRARRVLLVLDNVEVLLEEGTSTGRMHADAQEYARLLRLLGETRHQSCLLLTSREKPADLVPLEGNRSPVRALRLAGLDDLAGTQILTEKEVVGSQQNLVRLVEVYQGNPLALKIVAQTIVELFGGEVIPFLRQGEAVFGGVRALLDEQYARLSALEQTVLCWLAILREPVSLEDLLCVLVAPLAPRQLLEAVDALRRRSLIERGQRAGSFTLQSVVLEFVTDRLVTTATQEIKHRRLRLLREHGLSQAQAKEYVRQTQERLLLTPLLDCLKSVYRGRAEAEERLYELLSTVRAWDEQAQGYGPANLVALLRLLRGDLRGLDLSQLALRGVHLQDVEMQDATLAGSHLQESVFRETFDAITAVATSKSDQYWAAASGRGEVRVWREAGQTLHLVWSAHADSVWALAFSPDERQLASASSDGTVKLWDVESRALLWSGRHTSAIVGLAFSPDGDLLASGGHDASIRVWDPKLGTPLQDVPHPGAVFALAWSPDGRRLASSGSDGHIQLWKRQPTGLAYDRQTLAGHTHWVRGLAFSPDGSVLASAGWDGNVNLWELASGRCAQTLKGHTQRVHCVAWSADGATLASGCFDHAIRLWDVQEGRSRVVLSGHGAAVHSLAFTSDSRHLLSGSDDGTLRLWEVERGQCVRVLQGYAASLHDLAWSPDGTQLVSGGTDTHVTVWEVASGMPRGVLRGHSRTVYGVAWSPDGRLLASCGWDHAIRNWHPTTGACVQILGGLDHSDTVFSGVAWSPDGERLASGTLLQGVLVWDGKARSPRWLSRQFPPWIRRVAWSPDGTRLVGGGGDGHVYVWDASDGTLLQRLSGHQGAVTSVAWSPNGSRLASGSGSNDRGEGFVWDAQRGERVFALAGHPGVVSAVAWSPCGKRLISGGSDGKVRWWEIQSEQCVQVQEGHQGAVHALKVSPDGGRLASCGDDGAIVLWDLERGKPLRTLRRDRPYERLTITGIRGLSDAQKASLHALGAVEEISSGEYMRALFGEREVPL
ncbi:NB-ARC domain-containing protein [Ktedonobacter racemifer]|uniref:Transcriptional regulator, XRE family n=1 Tax=Ktedonobacter racemifer DSM 44963 TaxID=485913 RepID=D6TBB9_KTERA|nr:NB-ARC domain-containing protein [Ktedonobacter racemifer]EFH87903.1 transcriptional regulator, XRE family [Ktedonobacter racemifer DSM 44963]